MPRPTARAASSFRQFRQRVPADLRGRATGTPFVVEFPATAADAAIVVQATIGNSEVAFSLRTRDPVTAKARTGIAVAALEGLFSALRSGPVSLNHRQTVALAGEVYRTFVDRHSDEPATPAVWSAVKGLNRALREGRIDAAGVPRLSVYDVNSHPIAAAAIFGATEGAALTAAINARPAGPERDLEQRFGGLVDFVLAKHGLVVDDTSRQRMLVQVADASSDAARALKRNASGDYTPDPVAQRFPPVELPKSGEAKPTTGPTWNEVVDLWSRHHEAAGGAAPTRTAIRSFVDKFAKWVDKGPASVSSDDVRRWRDKRIEGGIALSTINDKDLSHLRMLYRLASEERLLDCNPALDVRVRRSRQLDRNMRAHSDATVAAVLSACQRETLPYRRWVPLLLASTGSRASAVMNLRACDVKQIDGTWCIEITTEASKAVKTSASCRIVPLHPAVVDAGFVAFAKTVTGTTPLFYGQRAKRRGIAAHNPGQPRNNHLRDWIQGLGLSGVGREHRRDTLHGFRHWFKAAARSAGIEDSISDALSGHAPTSEAARYGSRDVSVKALAEAVTKLRLPECPRPSMTSAA